jgi:hypothetical protein
MVGIIASIVSPACLQHFPAGFNNNALKEIDNLFLSLKLETIRL